MDKRTILILVLASALIYPLITDRPTDAQSNQASGVERQLRIGVVDLYKVYTGYNRTSELKEQFDAEKQAFEDHLGDLEVQIQDMTEMLQDLNPESETYKQYRRNLALLYAEYEYEKEQGTAELKETGEQYMRDILGDIEVAVREYGRSYQYTAIFKTSTMEAEEDKLLFGFQNVLYFTDAIDITEDIIEAINQ